jgi:hypothetical protein
MKKKLKKIPKFNKEHEEREFWHTRETTDYFDFSKSSGSRSNLIPDRGAGEVHFAAIAARDIKRTQSAGKQKGHSLSIAHQSISSGENCRRAESRIRSTLRIGS